MVKHVYGAAIVLDLRPYLLPGKLVILFKLKSTHGLYSNKNNSMVVIALNHSSLIIT